MAYAGLHVSHEPRIFFEPRCCYQNKNAMRNHRLHLVRTRLPSHVWLKGGNASSSRLFSRGRSSVHPMYSKSRQKILVCRSSLLPTDVNQIPVIKTAGLVIKSSYDVLNRSPLALKLIPAFGVVAFAAWGLGPLIRLIRIIFLQRSDNSWKKSSTHYITSSYVQPLLIWTGVTLICRALDPVVLPTEASQAVKQRLLNFARSLSTVLAFAYCLSSLIQQAQKFFVEKNESTDASRNMGFSFAGKAIYSAVWVAAVSLFMELLGFSTQKWLTAGGLGTVLLTLAGREIFTNFLSSVMIHATRPFVVNEWIQTKIEGYEVSGTVEHVGWWSPTIIRGDDREAVHIPNHKFTVSVVRNLTQKTHWRIKTHLAISHLDVNKINSIVADMRKVLAKNPQVEQQRLHRRVFLENINPENQALMILISCFVKTSHFEEYLCVKEAILLDLLRVISHHRARLATPIRTVQKIYSDADMDNIPFADGIYSRPRGSANRPLLLIEPSYKVSEEKTKSPSRKPNEEKDAAKVETTAAATDLKEAKKDEKSSKVTNAAASEKKDQNLGKPDSPQAPKDQKTDALNLKEGSSSDSVSGKADKNPAKVETTSTATDLKEAKKDEKASKVTNAAASDKKDQNLGKPDSPQAPKDKKTDALREGSSSDFVGKADKDGERAVAASSPSNTSRAPLEENIVLGVALEGSKRTLPIEEEETVPSEPKELTAQRNGSGSSSGNDGQASSSS